MKKALLTCLFFVGAYLAFSQNSGRGFSYQAVARNKDGSIKAAENVKIQFSLLPGTPNTNPIWKETQVATTDEFGIFNLIIGKGIKSGGTAATFKEVNFAATDFWLAVEIEDNSTWQEISKTQLLSVPYAEVAGNASPAPIGSMMIFAGPKDKVPAGWLICDGRELNRTSYAALYSVIGTAWGHGNGSTTFRIPDMRGVFPRGVSEGRYDNDYTNRPAMYAGGNTNNNVGSFQGESLKSHNHTAKIGNSGNHTHKIFTTADDDGQNESVAEGNDSPDPKHLIETDPAGAHTHSITIDISGGGNETRPDNVYVYYIIKI